MYPATEPTTIVMNRSPPAEEPIMEISRKFWVEQRSHAVWAVELHDHTPARCYGPLTLDEVDDDLIESFDYSTGGVGWIRENEEHFTALVPSVPEIPGM
jgi:hypothetical protein